MALEETEVESVDRGGERQVVSMSENLSLDGGGKDEAEAARRWPGTARASESSEPAWVCQRRQERARAFVGVRTKDACMSAVGETV